ncbi:MAG TPA: copper resistance system multicopper oxidase [Steroidobacteraceae bacterium]
MYRSRSTSAASSPSRRRFVQGLAGGVLTIAGARHFGRAAATDFAAAAADSGDSGDSGAILSGTEFNLEIGALAVNFTGQPGMATTVNGRLPAPLLRWREGDTVTLRVSNRLSAPSSIHWHGIILPADMDGVPGLSFDGIRPGETYVYRFKVNQSGTYWYHSHSRFQEQTGLYGPIVIEPRRGERHRADREHVVLLSEWTNLDPEHIYRTLKRRSNSFNFGQRTVGDFVNDVRKQGWKPALADRRMWGQMRMDPTDLADVSGSAYTYLMNGATPVGNWTGLFRRGEKVRLRIINGSSMSIFDVRIPGLKLTVVATDGQDVEPITVDEFRIGTAEVYDVIVEPKDDRAYTIFAQSLDRSGFARGTLAPQLGMPSEVPPLDPRPLLTMVDMGMGHDMSSMPGMQPQTRLDDPGIGLRNNGRRVLTYADLHTLGGPIDHREPGRDIELHLTGHMERFVWSFSGQKFSESEPLRFNHGERLRLVLVNDSMMHHPIHLHGMWGEVESEKGEFLVRKHTITVQPGKRLAYGVTADALGRWAYHCHLLYHMEAGMFREVHVERTPNESAKS